MSDQLKCDQQHGVKVPVKLKQELDKFSRSQIHAMNDEIRKVIARHVHMSKFNPDDYLSD